MIGVGALVVGVIEGPIRGWFDSLTVMGLGIGVVLLATFAWSGSLRVSAPLLDVRLFRSRSFSTGSLLVFSQFFVVFGYFFVAAQYLGFVREYSPFQIAAALLPVGVLLPVMSMRPPACSARWGRGKVGALGLVLMALADSAYSP